MSSSGEPLQKNAKKKEFVKMWVWLKKKRKINKKIGISQNVNHKVVVEV